MAQAAQFSIGAQDARTDPAVLRLAAYWSGLAGGDGLPRKAALSPTDIPLLLPDLLLLQRLEGDWLIRLAGSRIVNAYGVEIGGKLLRDVVPPAVHCEFFRIYEQARNERAPLYVTGRLHWQDRAYMVFRSGLFPMLGSGETVDYLLAAVVFQVEV
ncbi:MAG TPA: PAS domain-containing protein [Alphaproteobacteria bacterium]|nr:PAS domain-containing protein [Alphaproteobacteria bacterium]